MNEGDYDIVQISRFGKNGKSEDDTAVTAFEIGRASCRERV